MLWLDLLRPIASETLSPIRKVSLGAMTSVELREAKMNTVAHRCAQQVGDVFLAAAIQNHVGAQVADNLLEVGDRPRCIGRRRCFRLFVTRHGRPPLALRYRASWQGAA